ncbi:hypothetical protein Dxin01_02683 [Deinococcus xinjiangensis]|uniref:Lipoprotein n=1 Tax=Deinococcus xinjiangensis TaxID=457454 RepID=A0ABP9VCG4_9DEIO
MLFLLQILLLALLLFNFSCDIKIDLDYPRSIFYEVAEISFIDNLI